eukprot:CAMPEP_0119087046 /NCGR_PEP_ID=MMETSP1178-20130426/140224_1 /TAXON_ID=33656 /ORGANISM="unid sp, Strain CCMP2000" /LENGTH=49 /DNA_ID= /DNA_START= /DNA_END= /DNA_ORIENTATION=
MRPTTRSSVAAERIAAQASRSSSGCTASLLSLAASLACGVGAFSTSCTL